MKNTIKDQSIVPQVVQAPIEPVRPDILEKLTYHKYERDDLTLDDCLEYLCNQWKKIHGRTERAMVMQITELLASQPVAAPIVATVPSEPVAWMNPNEGFCRDAFIWSEDPNCSPEYNVPVFLAAPSPTEQASDVRNAALIDALKWISEMCEQSIFVEPLKLIQSKADNAIALASLKSAAPADKGNAPAEANNELTAGLLDALQFLLEKAESFNANGVYFDRFRENKDALDTARNWVAKAKLAKDQT